MPRRAVLAAEMPRQLTPRELRQRHHGSPCRSAVRRPPATKDTRFHDRRNRDAGARHRRQHHHLLVDSTQRLFTVVGVVKDVLERGYGMESKQEIYVTAAQGPRYFPAVNLVVRVDKDPLGYGPAVQRVIRAVDPDQPIRLIRSMTEVIALTVGDRRQQTTMLVVFGALALVIASLGLYGLLAQAVSARGREIGIRMALGATWRNVMRMVMSRGIALTGAGVGIGALLAWSVTRAMETLLYGVGAADPLTFALVAGLLAVVSTVACAVPAVRAARVDPMLVLRDQ
jgi:putative ABC transport system permease protein